MNETNEATEMKIVSDERKLIFRPESGAPVVTFPEGAIVNEWGVNNVTPSIVVRNGTEEKPSYQGVDHATGVVIINQVPEDVAHGALIIFKDGGQTIDALAEALKFLISGGYDDQYTSELAFVDSKLSPAGRMIDEYNGIVKRDDRDQVLVWREGDIFCVAIEDERRVIEREILQDTYRNPDGTRIDLTAVPEGRPESVEA